MYPVTEAIATLFDQNQPQVLRITGVDKNGASINISNANIMSGGFSIDRFSVTGTRLEVGAATAAELTLKLNNSDGTFDGIVFEGAELFVEIGIADWTQDNPSITWIPCGYFTPDEQPRNRTIITLHALDRMVRFDAVPPALTPWGTEDGKYMTDEFGNILCFCADLVFPTTIQGLVEQCCVRCGVQLAGSISGLPNAGYVISEIPNIQQQITFRTLIQWCAGLMGTNAFIDWNGELRFSWYTNTGYDTTPNRRYSSDLYENDITVTGVSYTDNDGQAYIAGTDDYAISLAGNYFLSGVDENAISVALQALYGALNGFTYRPFEAKVMPAPWLFPMDRISFTDLNGTSHITILTNVNTTINGGTYISGRGETKQTSSYVAPSGLTAAQTQALQRVLQASNEQVNAAIQNATDQITGAQNSTVKFVYNDAGGLSEILVMDAPDINTAVNVWRWNSGGLGHSSNGYGGPYSLAMTQDGSIVATMITTGVLNASLIKAGIIEDVLGLNYWNMATGELVTQKGTIGDFTLSNGNLSYSTNSRKVVLNSSGLSCTAKYASTPSKDTTIQVRPDGIGWSDAATPNDLFSLISAGTIAEDPGHHYLTWSFPAGGVSMDVISLDSDYNRVQFNLYGASQFGSINTRTNATIGGNLTVTGTKSRVVETGQYSERLFYCYETASPIFGDVGEGVISEDGMCHIWLDPIFASAIGDSAYQVFVQAYWNGECCVVDRKPGYFVVSGDPGMTFGWEIKAKQRDYENRRLDTPNEREMAVAGYGDMARAHLSTIKNWRETQ